MRSPLRLQPWISGRAVRLYALFLLLAILPVGLFSYFANRALKRQTDQQSVQEAGQAAQVAAILVEQQFRQSTAFLESYARRLRFRQEWARRSLTEVTKDLEQAHQLWPDFVFLSVYDPDGTMRAIYPVDEGVLNHNFAFRDWYRGVSQGGQPYVSEVYRTAVLPQPLVVAIAIPIRDEQGEVIGILMAAYALDTISHWLRETSRNGTWITSVVDQHGQLAAHPSMDTRGPPLKVTAYEPIANVLQGQEGGGVFGRNGQEQFVGYAPIRPYGWGTLSEQPTAVARAAIKTAARRMWSLGLLLVGLALGSAGLLAFLYRRMEWGEQFLSLSNDLFCVANFDRHFTWVNPAWSRALGYSSDELLARPYMEFVHPDDRGPTDVEAKGIVEDGIGTVFENRYRCKDGSYKWLLWNSVAVPGKRLIYAVARDVTDRKRAEESLSEQAAHLARANAELKASNKELEAFTYSVSHDLRSPLRHIAGFSQLLLEDHGSDISAEAQRYLGRVCEATRQMGQLVDDLLNLARVSRQELKLQVTGLKSVVDEVVAALKRDNPQRDIEWRIQALPFVECDPALMKQVFANLLSNAVKFTRQREHPVIEVGATNCQSTPVISVRDNGVGFSMKYADKLFGVFQRLHRSEDFEGTGVGLATVQRVIHKHGGCVWANAELDKGATFYFTVEQIEQVEREGICSPGGDL